MTIMMTMTRVFKKLLPAAFYLLVFSIPFGTRKLIWQFTEGFNEYSSIFIYGTDILMMGILGLWLLSLRGVGDLPVGGRARQPRFNLREIASVALAMTIFLSIFFAYSKGLAFYNFSRIFILAVFALVVADLIKKEVLRLDYIWTVLAASAVFQSFIAIAQFARQGSVGLHILGEPFLNTETSGIAKLAIEGGRYIRAYGTMPHPNVLGAFLVLGLLALIFLWLLKSPTLIPAYRQAGSPLAKGGGNQIIFTPSLAKGAEKRESVSSPFSRRGRIKVGDVFLVISTPIIILALILTFSRSAWFVAVISTLLIIFLVFRDKEKRKSAIYLFFVFAVSVTFLIYPLRSLVFPRAEVFAEESAVTARLSYNKLALEIIKNKPFGVGIGNQVIYAAREGLYIKIGMDKVWQWQPIHNIYLLIAAETGVVGLAMFLWFVVELIAYRGSRIARNIQSSRLATGNMLFAAIKVMLGALLLLGLLDHYLWTIQSGRLMLWLVIGMVLGLTDCNTKYYNDKHENNN